MRFLMLIRLDERAGRKPDEQLLADMGRLLEEMTAAGTLLDTAGLRPTAEGARIRLSRGKLATTDGPFTEAREVVGGYAMLEAASLAQATALASRFLETHGEDWEIECEVRALDEDCGRSS